MSSEKRLSNFKKKYVYAPEAACVTDRHDMTSAVKVALNPNTTYNLQKIQRPLFLSNILESWP